MDCSFKVINRVMADVKRTLQLHGWQVQRVKIQHKSRSRYIIARQGDQEITVRMSDHPPMPWLAKKVAVSIHPGGDTKEDLIKRLRGEA